MNYQIVKESNFDKLRKEIKKIKSENKIPLLIIKNDDLTRKIAEKEKDLVIAVELKNRKDKLYQRDSGLDKPTADFSRKNNIIIGILLEEILNSNLKEKSQILARIKQNIKIAKKAKIKIKFISLNEKNKKDFRDLHALALILGSNPKIAKEASQSF